jgi:hypothetical protein
MGEQRRMSLIAYFATVLLLARAPAAAEVAVDAVGACPEGAEVRRLLGALVSGEEVRGAVISIQDRGPHYRIAVGGSATTLDDPARDCAGRARRAAVVAASLVQAPKVVFGPPVWTIEKGLVIELAPTADDAVWAYGAEFRGAYGSAAWSVVGAAGARGPVTLKLQNGWKADLLRLPLDVGARLTGYRWRLRPWLVIGGSATLNRLYGRDLVDTQNEWRLGLGPIAMVGATLPVKGRLGLAAALAVRWEPRPYHLQVVPVGEVGETPRWWLGLSLNYTVDGKGSSP